VTPSIRPFEKADPPSSSQIMKVVHVIIGLNRGGAESMLRNLVLSSKVNKHVVLSLTLKGEVGVELEQAGVVVYELGMRSFLSLPMVFLRLIAVLRRESPDVVQTWMVHSDLIGGLAALASGVRHVIWGVRTTDYRVEARSTQAVRWLCALLSHFLPSRIVAAAQASLESSVKAGYSKRKMLVIPNGFDIDYLQRHRGKGRALRENFCIGPDEVVVGCLGRHNPAKDHFNFIQAAGLVASAFPKCRFLMVGNGLTSANKDLMTHVDRSGFSSRFLLLGERSDAAACLDAMDIFVLSSCTEGFPNVLGEAMVMSVPCVSTDVGDAAVILGGNGELVPPRDSSALAAALLRLLEMSSSDRATLGRRGRDHVEQHFSIARAVQQFDDLYSTLKRQ
jgi:glycosyltransferase involved in cell wall biosynthesis